MEAPDLNDPDQVYGLVLPLVNQMAISLHAAGVPKKTAMRQMRRALTKVETEWQ